MSLEFDGGGIERVKLQLRRLAFVEQIATEEMRVMTKELQQKAQWMAPIEFGDLRKSIQIRETGFVKGRRDFEVFINDNTPVTDPKKIKDGITRVGQYAWEVHEHMGYASAPNYQYMPSKLSVEDGLSHGVEAGGKFLERAAVDLIPLINARLARVVFKYTDSLAI